MTFSAAESAFLSINKLRVRILRQKKDKRAVRVWLLLKDKDRLINTLLVCNNIVNIALSSLLAYLAIELFGRAGVGIATFVATILLLIFGEISPKTFATHHPETIAYATSGLVLFLEKALFPLVVVFTFISHSVLKSSGVKSEKNVVSYTEEEIKTFLDVGCEQGVIENSEQKLMNRVFKFTDLEAKDIMVPRIQIKAVPIDAIYSQIIETSQRLRLSRFPVYKTGIDDIVGVLYLKDMISYKSHPQDFSLEKVMRPPLFILETKKMTGIQEMLRENHQSMAIVLDEYSGTNGVLTREDIVREIFGPITDEFKLKTDVVELKIEDKNNSEISGLSRLMDLNEQLGTKITSRDSETIGGYICETIGEIPNEGDSVVADGYKFTVLKIERNRVASVKLEEVEA